MRGLSLIFAAAGLAVAIYGLASSTLARDEVVFRVAMGLVIAGVGVAIGFLGADTGAGRIDRARVEQHPEAPWLWRADWAQGFAEAETRSQARTWGLAGVICLLMSVPIGLQLPSEILRRGNYPALVGLAFPVVGLWLVTASILGLLRDRKYRGARLEMPATHGVLGGKLSGRIVARGGLAAGTSVDLTLSCVHSYASRKGNDRTRWQRVLWQGEQTVKVLSDGRDCFVPVDFTVPFDVRETDGRNADDEILWRVGSDAKVAGLDFRMTFTAPVFRSAGSDPSLTAARLDFERQARAGGMQPAGAQISGSISDQGGMEFYLPPGRNKAAAATVTFFGLLTTGSGLFFGFMLQQNVGWLLGALPVLVFGGLGALLLMISISLWFGSTTIAVRNREMAVRSRCFGMGKTRTIPAADIAKLELHSGMQHGDQVWYDLRVHLTSGRKVHAGSGMSRKEADWLLAEIRSRLGIAAIQSAGR